MTMPVEGDVLVDFVGDREEIVRSAHLRDERQLVVVQHLAGRIVRRVHDERPDRRLGHDAAHLVRSSRQVPASRSSRRVTNRGTSPKISAWDGYSSW